MNGRDKIVMHCKFNYIFEWKILVPATLMSIETIRPICDL